MKFQPYHQKIRHFFFLFCLVLSMCLFTACSSDVADSQESQTAQEDSGRLQIVATMFPQYDFARQIAGDKADVTLLVDPGIEVHAYEPTANDLLNVHEADCFFYMGAAMEPWTEKVVPDLTAEGVAAVDLSAEILTEEDLAASHYDLHIWTDPNYAMIMVKEILTAMTEKDPANADYYTEQANLYLAELQEVDAAFQQVVAEGKRNLMVFADRFPFYYFAKRYGLDYLAAYDSCAEESEPSMKQITELINVIKEEQIPVVYYEELTEPKVATSISEETGAKAIQFHSCHNVSKEDFDAGITYVDLMKRNVEALQQGLN